MPQQLDSMFRSLLIRIGGYWATKWKHTSRGLFCPQIYWFKTTQDLYCTAGAKIDSEACFFAKVQSCHSTHPLNSKDF